MNGTTPSSVATEDLLAQVCEIARRAGERIMEVYRAGFDVAAKADASPVTEADLQSEKIILQALAELTPEIPAVSEEAVERGEIPSVSNGRFCEITSPVSRRIISTRPSAMQRATKSKSAEKPHRGIGDGGTELASRRFTSTVNSVNCPHSTASCRS